MNRFYCFYCERETYWRHDYCEICMKTLSQQRAAAKKRAATEAGEKP